MSRQSNFTKRQFFQKSMARAQATQKRKKDIQSIKNGNFVEPDPSGVIETEDVMEADLEVTEDE